ncbi:cell division protein FtsA [Lysobacter sp. TY2-98]|uniref:cell division protein FtsA n=1 Tax=Lysobacter sp. TY2-98 TaxID=2290922 RepID=UPI000E20597E|nr:cell division protein FtsA [Lysobacter sp. TY2-98]AXK70970.1 cell division protein FtsA [Lysobacter sp. TY2-98]
MNRKGDKSLIVGLDIGTSKVTALVGEYLPGQPIEVIGLGSHESRGMRRGVVVDIDSTVQSIQRAIEEAELMAGCEIRSVYASISGSHIQCRNSQGIAPIRDNSEVTYADLDRVLDAAKAVAIPADQKILHAIPRDYVLDDSQEGIRNPVGMTGVRLEVHAHLVICAQSAAANISKCVQKCGLAVDDLILSVLASSQAVLTPDERELGVVCVDIGAGTTDIAVFVQGAIAHSASLPIAGDKVTEDIAHMLRTPTPEAEQIKVRYACALSQMATAEESIQVPSVGDRPPRRMPRASLAQAVQARYEEIFEMVQAELRRSGFEQHVRAGMVLTGGASKMEGVVELAEEMLQMPVRVGIPQHVTGLGEVVGNPVHGTGVGLLLMGSQIENPRRPMLPTGRAGGFLSKLKNWYRGEF